MPVLVKASFYKGCLYMKKPFKELWILSFQGRTRPHLESNPSGPISILMHLRVDTIHAIVS
jgi:hypothetical protein